MLCGMNTFLLLIVTIVEVHVLILDACINGALALKVLCITFYKFFHKGLFRLSNYLVE